MKTFIKKYWKQGAVTVVMLAAVAILAIVGAPHHPAQAQSTVPNIFLDGIYNGGGIASVKLSLSGSGPFTENFQVAVCFQEQGRNGNRIDCAHTPWAASSTPYLGQTTANGVPSGITNSNYVKWWSDWSAAPQQTIDANWTATTVPPNGRIDAWDNGWQGYNYGTGWYEVQPSLFIRTAPLSTGQIITNVQLGFEQIDVNSMGQMQSAATTAIDANECQNSGVAGPVPWVITPIGGGAAAGTIGVQDHSNNTWSLQDPGASYAYTYGQCAAYGSYGSGQVITSGSADYFRVYLAAGAYNAANPGNNIPTSTTPSAQMTVGTNGGPLTFTIQNTGSAPWTSNLQTFVSATGVCDGGGTQPNPTQGYPVGTSCVSTYSNSSNVFQLAHVSGVFGTGSDPLRFSQQTQETCSISSTMGCLDSSSNCSNDQQACTGSGYCSNSGASDQQSCWESNGSWTNGCNSQWVNQVSCTQTGGDSSVEPGQTATFKLSSLTATATPGNYTEQWQMKNGNAAFGSVIPVNIQVGSGATSTTSTTTSVATGTITVTSQNAVTQGPVNATWDITDMGSGPLPATDPSFLNYDGDVCDLVGNTLCHGSSQTYTNQPAVNTAMPSVSYGSVTMVTSSIALYNPADSSLYSFNSVRVTPIAQKKVGMIDEMLSLAKSVFGSTAEAFVLQQPAAQTLTATQPVNYTILWNPVANIEVSSTPNPLQIISVQSSPGSGQIQIVNTGAPGSQLTWTTTSDSSWLTASPPADSSGLTNDNSGNDASEYVTINATPQSVGSHTGHITFYGTSNPGNPSQPLQSTLTVKYTVTANPSSVTGVSIVGGACNPSAIDTNGTANCTATVSGTGGYDKSVTWSVSIGTITSTGADSASFNSSNPGTATIKACSTQSPSICDTATITVAQALVACTPGVNCPKCSDPIINASPTNIVIPESSVLSYKCDNVTSCTLKGNDGSNYPVTVNSGTASSTQPVNPKVTTVYTFSCTNSGYTPQSATVSLPVQVSVGGTSRCEQNPNGAGCPGQ